MLQRVNIAPNHFCLVDLEEDVYIQVINMPKKTYVKELGSLGAFERLLIELT